MSQNKASKPKSALDRFVQDVEPIEQVEAKELAKILQELFDNITDGDNRAIIRKYQTINSDESIHNILWSLHKDLKGGEAKGIVFGFVKALENI